MFPWYSFKLPMHYRLPKVKANTIIISLSLDRNFVVRVTRLKITFQDDFDAIVLLYGNSSNHDYEVVIEEDSDWENETNDTNSSGEGYGQEAEEPIVPERYLILFFLGV